MSGKNKLAIKNKTDAHPLISPEWLRARDKAAIPSSAFKDQFSRMNRFITWMEDNDLHWTSTRLADYRDYLAERGLALRSIASTISTVRESYRRALRDNSIIEQLREQSAQRLERVGQPVTPSNVQALVDATIKSIENNIDPINSSVSQTTVQDRSDEEHTWLESDQVATLLGSFDKSVLIQHRDFILIALLVGMGIRSEEACDLKVEDVDVKFGGESALRIAHGKGNKKRIVPYGAQEWLIEEVYLWLNASGIGQDDPKAYVIRGFHASGRYVLDSKMTTRSIQRVMEKLSKACVLTDDEGNCIKIEAHDLRRTYADLLYKSGMDIVKISKNMGHGSIETTKGYLRQSVSDRRPQLLFKRPT